MDLTFIEEIEELFKHRWAPYILLCLVGGPQRYTAISQTINRQITDHLSESVLSRTLEQLETAGLARSISGARSGRGRRRGPWVLTPAAQPIVAKLQRLQRALADDAERRAEPEQH